MRFSEIPSAAPRPRINRLWMHRSSPRLVLRPGCSASSGAAPRLHGDLGHRAAVFDQEERVTRQPKTRLRALAEGTRGEWGEWGLNPRPKDYEGDPSKRRANKRSEPGLAERRNVGSFGVHLAGLSRTSVAAADRGVRRSRA